MDHISFLLSSFVGCAGWETAVLQLFADLFSSCKDGAGMAGHLEVLVAEPGRRRGKGICYIILVSLM